ncbi:MAG: electron transfer flavoprotein subunit alpha, partial [Bryobacteraceae bacterium]|nr:electron transfer flavoprotein subunit alpha [Bryobacteraceae bacterium]
FGVEGAEFGSARYSTDAAAAEAICRAADGCGLVVAPGTSRWMRALPGVAQRVGARVDSHVVGLAADGSGAMVARRWVYRNRMEAAVTRPTPWMVLLDSGAGAAWSGPNGAVEVQRLTVDVLSSRTEVLRVESPQADQQTIRPEAKLLMVAGAGWTKKQKDGQTHVPEASELIQDLLRLTGASLGSSKSLVDLGSEGESVLPFLTHMHQVGQTGSSPRHAKGLATCCHGEEPHVVGWRFVNERRAVNLDANCGWGRKKADVLYVADAFEVAREIRKLLGA